MTCPLFIDYTRNCLSKFPQFIKYSDYTLCTSDNYIECLHYIVLNSKSRCKYIIKCINFVHENSPPDFLKKIFFNENSYSIIKDFTVHYCLSLENCKDCETYKKYESGDTPTKFVFPDGKTHLLDILLKHKIKVIK